MTGKGFLEKAKIGTIVHVRSKTWFGRVIRWCLTKWVRRLYGDTYFVWGNHDALVVRGPDGKLYVGEALAGHGSVPTPVFDYVVAIDRGDCEVRLFDPCAVTDLQRQRANNRWWMNVKGTPYDYAAFVRLFIKSVLFDVWAKSAGWKWANWCTEGVGRAYEEDLDIFQTANPTPLTAEQVAGILPQRPGKLVTLVEL